MSGTETATVSQARASSFELRTYASLDSTSDEAKRLGRAGGDAIAILAEQQTAGRGRLNRSWSSPKGNLHLSLLLRPTQPLASVAQLGFVAALAVAEAIAALGPSVSLKWPNDVLAYGRKLAGILLESSSAGSNTAVDWLVVGIGVNVALAPLEAATSLRSLGVQTTPERVAVPVISAFCRWRDRWETEGFAPVRQAWLARGHRSGEALRVRDRDVDRFGTFRDLDEDGVLVLDTERGPLRVTAGDVHLAA